MTQTWLFLKKELAGNWRTKKLPILLIIFIVTGVISPFLAKITPELMTSLLPSDLQIKLPEPTSVDSWTQFYKNLPQFGLLALVLLSTGTISGEIKDQTLIPFITKGLSRTAVVLSKALYLFAVWTVGLLTAFGVNYGYTRYYFNDTLSPDLLMGLWPFWLYGLLFLTFTLLASAITSGAMESLLLVVIFYAISMLTGLVQKAAHFDPFVLGSHPVQWLSGAESFNDYWPAALIAAALTLSFLLLALMAFRRRRI